MEPDEKRISDFVSPQARQIADLLRQLFEEVRSVIEKYNDAAANEDDLKKIKDYYYKKKYLLRLKESLDTFGDA